MRTKNSCNFFFCYIFILFFCSLYLALIICLYYDYYFESYCILLIKTWCGRKTKSEFIKNRNLMNFEIN